LPAAARVSAAVTAAELPIVIALSPALMFPTPARLAVLLAVPIVWSCARVATGRFVPRTPLNAALWLLLAMVGVSLFVTPDVHESLGKISGVVLGVLIYWAALRWLRRPARLKTGIVVFLTVGLVLAVVGMLGTPVQHKFGVLTAIATRLPFLGAREADHLVLSGIPGAPEGFNPNPVSGCLILFIPLQVLLLVRGGHRWLVASGRPQAVLAVVQAACLLVTAGTVLVMQSRGAWAGLAIAVTAAAIFATRSRRLTACVVVIGLLLTVGLAPRAWRAIQHPGVSPEIGGAAAQRLELWSKALLCIRDFPLTGMGMNMFRTRMPARYPVFVNPHEGDVVHAHNNLLQAALDVGLPGLAAYLAIWIGAIACVTRVYRRDADAMRRTIALGLWTGLVAHFAFGMTDAIALGAKVGVVFWLTLALAMGLGQLPSESLVNERFGQRA
jgi:hypothetical protein